MRKHVNLWAAASLAVGGAAFLSSQSVVLADDMSPAAGSVSAKSGRADLPNGITKSDQRNAQGIQQTLASATDAVIAGDYSRLDQLLASADRSRIDLTQQQKDEIKKSVDQFKQDWKAKYNQDFSLAGHEPVVFGDQFKDFIIVQGEVSNPALLSNWPVESTNARSGSEKPGDRATVGGPGQTSINVLPGDRGAAGGSGTGAGAGMTGENARETAGAVGAGTGGAAGGVGAATIEKGAAVAIVTFPSSGHTEETTVSLIKESGAGLGAAGQQGAPGEGQGGAMAGSSNWRIDIPDSIGSQQLADNLKKHLSEVQQMKTSWPADQNEAYRVVSHHVLMALYDASGRM